MCFIRATMKTIAFHPAAFELDHRGKRHQCAKPVRRLVATLYSSCAHLLLVSRVANLGMCAIVITTVPIITYSTGSNYLILWSESLVLLHTLSRSVGTLPISSNLQYLEPVRCIL